MDSRGIIVASVWFAVAIFNAMFLQAGGINLMTSIVAVLLFGMAFVITFAVTFGLEGMRQESPQAKAKLQMNTELSEIKGAVSDLTKKVDAIQKELEQ
ncbi:MAG TPA: hypothetical protein VLH35_02825 [Candidatus Acidoferrales bacterium]|nr:hypothetical protein [Candidatus Acidoferrales bacterium]